MSNGTKTDLKKLAWKIVYWSIVTGMVILVIGLTAIGSRIFYQFGYDIFYDVPYDSDSTEEMIVTVPEGCSMWLMAGALKEEGIIKNDIVFYVQSLLYGGELAVGEHIISPAMTSEEIIKILSVQETMLE